MKTARLGGLQIRAAAAQTAHSHVDAQETQTHIHRVLCVSAKKKRQLTHSGTAASTEGHSEHGSAAVKCPGRDKRRPGRGWEGLLVGTGYLLDC